ncbi:MAG: protein translocase subunit SecD, partial [Bryobacterales bacterium]|nr:protein translocase subunit SecD [Bryobacterales bacterium]
MPKTLLWKWITIGLVVLGCVFGVAGLPSSKEQLIANWKRNIRLGLDLQGGAHIVLQVQVQDAYKAEADQVIARLKDALQKQNVSYNSVERNDPVTVESAGTIQIMVRGVGTDKASDARRVITETAGGQWTMASTSSTDYTLSLKPEAAVEMRRETMTQTMNTMERKISGLGVAEASVQQRGGSGDETEILVQLPGLDDPARVRSVLQATALLELYPVKGGPFATRDQAYTSSGGVLPLGSKLMRGARSATDGGTESWWLVANSPVVMGRDIRDAKAATSDRPDRWDTNFVLSQEAARRFGRYTETNIGQRLAIVLDKAVISAPVIEGRIEDQGRITGMGGQQEAADLALNLRAGSLPAGVKVTEERTVGPSLGADSIRRGVGSGLVGLALVVASM